MYSLAGDLQVSRPAKRHVVMVRAEALAVALGLGIQETTGACLEKTLGRSWTLEWKSVQGDAR